MLKRGKTALIVAITLGALGATSTAFAGGKDDDGAGHDRWEGKVGPSGQVLSIGQVQSGWSGQSGNAFAQAQTSQTKQKASKAAKQDSSTANKGETEEQARKRRYEDNR